jgi:hypothetical protein
MHIHAHIPIAHALTMLDSHNAAMRALHIPSGYEDEAHRWAQAWAVLRRLPQDDYAFCVNDARIFLREHIEEHLEWERRTNERPEREEHADGDAVGGRDADPESAVSE